MTKKKDPVLLWNERGQTGCTLPGHAPHKGSDTWRFEHWKKVPPGTLKEDGTPLRCETCAQADRAPAEQTPEPPAVEPEPEAPKKKRNDLMLIELALKYVKHMEKAGKSNGTIASYQLELKTALDHFGAETKVADLTPEKVLLYFGSARVMKKRNGKGKSPLSIAKTQRVLRLALVWAEGAKLIVKAPLPEDIATH
jgi:hypothetical protein